MYARRTVTKAAPEQAEKAKEVMENSLIPKAKQLPGFAGGYWLIDRASGEGLTFTFFDTKENLEASAAQAKEIRAGAASEIGATVQEVGQFEVGVDTGQKVHRGATYARVLNVEGDRETVERAKQMIMERVVPAARNFPGFVGGFWLFDADAGKVVGVTLFDSAENLAASREQAAGLRAQSQAAQPGGKFAEFKEYEVLTRAETPAGVGAG
jgi:hypothetical protein